MLKKHQHDNNNIQEAMETINRTTQPKRMISRTGRVARENKWVIEVLDPELQAQCKSYKDGKRIIRHETDA